MLQLHQARQGWVSEIEEQQRLGADIPGDARARPRKQLSVCPRYGFNAARAYAAVGASASTPAESLPQRISALEKAVKDQEMLREALRAAQKEIRELKDSARMASGGHQSEDSCAPRQHGQLILGEVAGTCRFFGNASPAYLLVCHQQLLEAGALSSRYTLIAPKLGGH